MILYLCRVLFGITIFSTSTNYFIRSCGLVSGGWEGIEPSTSAMPTLYFLQTYLFNYVLTFLPKMIYSSKMKEVLGGHEKFVGLDVLLEV